MTNYDESFYLCEGIWLDIEKKQLKDEHNKNEVLDIYNRDDQIKILEQEVKEWIISPIYTLLWDDITIQKIKDDKVDYELKFDKYRPFKNATFILFGVFSYIEKMQRYIEGIPTKAHNDNDSTEFLKAGVKRIFPHIKENIEDIKIVHNIRNSLMHSGMIHDDVYLNYNNDDYIEALSITKDGKIKINPVKLYSTIKEDFNSYLSRIRDSKNKDERDKFKKVFNNFYKKEQNFLK